MTPDDCACPCHWGEDNPNDCFLTCNNCYDSCVDWKKGHEDEP